ncbi:hypothetical protein GGF32_002713 [Allomyces javanicus]|nr:hypothetical protein GGF32_002713 [Allomyces javanicus]
MSKATCQDVLDQYLKMLDEFEDTYQAQLDAWKEKGRQIQDIPPTRTMGTDQCLMWSDQRDNIFRTQCSAMDGYYWGGQYTNEGCANAWIGGQRAICQVDPVQQQDKINMWKAEGDKIQRQTVDITNLDCQVCIQEVNNAINVNNTNASGIAQSAMQNCVASKYPDQPTVPRPADSYLPQGTVLDTSAPYFDYNIGIDLAQHTDTTWGDCIKTCEKDQRCSGFVMRGTTCWTKPALVSANPFVDGPTAWIKSPPAGGVPVVVSIHGPGDTILVERENQLYVGTAASIADGGYLTYEVFSKRIISQKDPTKCLTRTADGSVRFTTIAPSGTAATAQMWIVDVPARRIVLAADPGVKLAVPSSQLGAIATTSGGGSSEFVVKGHGDRKPPVATFVSVPVVLDAPKQDPAPWRC